MMERNKKVLLINPPESSSGGSTSAPLGLMYIAAVLQENNTPVHILDACLDGWDSIVPKIREYRPNIVGIVCSTYARVQAIKVAKIVKENLTDVTVILGGHHPTLMGEQLLENYPFIDLVGLGEGEYLMLDLCRDIKPENILGLGFRRNNKIIINELRPNIDNLDALPIPSWNLVLPKRYGTHSNFVYNGIDLAKEIGAGIVFSRGCIGRCNFCSNYLMWKKWKHRSAKNVADELDFLNHTYNIRCFQFNDDCFSANKKATIELCTEIIKRKLEILFSIITRADCVDEDVIRSLKEAGCYSVTFGIETVSLKLLKIMHKPIKIETSAKAIQLVNSFNLKSVVLFIAGCIGENWQTINETIDFLKIANPSDVGVANGLMLFPGTEVYNIAKQKGAINDSFWLTDYSWKIYTVENSRLMLNIFTAAIQKRKKISRFPIINLLFYHRFVTKEIEIILKNFLEKIGLRKIKSKKLKPKVAY